MFHMSQKSYNLLIVERLLIRDNHIRGLAKDLKTNQMTVSRRVQDLEKDNAVDYRQEGKNKVYFLKKTIEAREYLCLMEHEKLLRTLKRYPILRSIIQNIKKNRKIKLAILFGSYAKGIARKGSDIDMYVETMSKKLKKEVELLHTKLSVKTGKYDKENLLIKEIEKNHVIIKGVEPYYEKLSR